MKKIVDEIRKWATLAAFCGAAVGFYLNLDKMNSLESAVNGLQTFQGEQKEINARDEVIYVFVTKIIEDKIMNDED